MSGPWINAGREAEHQGAAREEHLPEGSLFCGDGNSFTLASMRERSKVGGLWLVPARATLYFYDEQGVKMDLISYLKIHAEDGVIDGWIQAGLKDRLECRLIAVHLNRAQRRIKTWYTVYQPVSSQGVRICGPKGRKTEKKRKKSRQKTKKTSTESSAGNAMGCQCTGLCFDRGYTSFTRDPKNHWIYEQRLLYRFQAQEAQYLSIGSGSQTHPFLG